MKRLLIVSIASALGFLGVFSAQLQAEVITPVVARATSTFNVGPDGPLVEDLINGDGLDGAGPVETQLHDMEENNGWLSGCTNTGIDGGSPEELGVVCADDLFAVAPANEQIIEFEFDSTFELASALIWQQNGTFNTRGIQNMQVLVSDRLVGPFTLVENPDDAVNGYFTLAQSTGQPEGAQTVSVEGLPGTDVVRRVRLQVVNTFSELEEYVGLFEVRFEGDSVSPADVFVRRSLSDTAYNNSTTPIGVTLDVGLEAAGPFDIEITENLPTNWTATDISGEGVLDAGSISWSLAAITAGSTLTYTLVPDDETLADVNLDGSFTLNGGEPLEFTGQNRLSFGNPDDPAIIRTLSRTTYNANLGVGVTLDVVVNETNTGPFDFTIADNLPIGFTAADISDDGSTDGATVSWSLPGVTESQSLTYSLVPPSDASASVTLTGEFAFNGLAPRDIVGQSGIEFKVFYQDGIITPISVLASSSFGLGQEAEGAINGSGLDGVGSVPDQLHDNNPSSMWMTGCVAQGLGLAPEDDGVDCAGDPFALKPINEQVIEFEFDTEYDLSGAHIWQYNEFNVNRPGPWPERGVQNFEMLVSGSIDGDFESLDIFDLDQMIGQANNLELGDFSEPAQSIELDDFPQTDSVRRVRFELVSSYGDTYVGLSEVRFEGTSLTGAPVFRRGDHDGSGIVDITDPLNLLSFLFLGLTPPICLDASDGDNSSAVDISDALNVLGFLFLGSFPLNATLPGPIDCGTDPTMAIDPDGPGGFPEQPATTLGCDQYPAETGTACP
jgi:hypothetical protein